MKINQSLISSLMAELIDENPLACRAVFSICGVEFTRDVETLCVTLGHRSVLQINDDFVSKHCRTECHIKALLLHEFLHLLLRHTTRFERMTPALNVALDAVINSIIHRRLGEDYSSFMAEYYCEAPGILRLLRLPNERERSRQFAFYGKRKLSLEEHAELTLLEAHQAVYAGKIVAEDVLDLCRHIKSQEVKSLLEKGFVLLGDHQGRHDPLEDLEPDVASRLRNAMRCLDGKGIWKDVDRMLPFRKKQARALTTLPPAWRREVMPILHRLISRQDPGGATVETPVSNLLPVLNSHDRRGWLRALWNPIIAENEWTGIRRKHLGRVQVYLDVSVSMNGWIDALVGLLWEFHAFIRSPFWSFSGIVEPAVIRNGHLETGTTGNTSLTAVLRHVLKTRPEKALIVTDGFVEEVSEDLVRSMAFCSLEGIVTPGGTTKILSKCGISGTMLPKIRNSHHNAPGVT